MPNPLNHPLDVKKILLNRKTLKKELLNKNINFFEKNIAILGGSTTREFKEILELFLLNKGLKPTFYESEYNKFFEESVYDNSNLLNFKPDIVYLHTSNINVSYPLISHSNIQVDQLLQAEMEKFRLVWESLKSLKTVIIQNNFEMPSFRLLGNLDCYDHRGATNFLMRINLEFSNEAKNNENLLINDINYISSLLGLDLWYDKKLWYHAKYAMSFSAMPDLADGTRSV